MPILPIRLYPDPVLRAPAVPIEAFDEALAQLADDMVKTMYAAPGVGLAAPQVGVSQRLAVVDVSVGKEDGALHVLVNPRIVAESGRDVDAEACLSIPGLSERVTRPLEVEVEAQDVHGAAFAFTAEGFFARAICHELDHLDGVLFVDHLRGLRRERARRTLRKLKASAIAG